MIVTGSLLRLVTTTLKVKVPPGSGSDAGVAVLSTEMIGSVAGDGDGGVVVSVTVVPSSSTPVTVTMSVWVSPSLPVKLAVNEQL